MEEMEDSLIKKTKEIESRLVAEKECPEIPKSEKDDPKSIEKCKKKHGSKTDASKKAKTKVYGGSFLF